MEALRSPARSSYYDFEWPDDTMPSAPNRLLHELGRKELQSYMRMVNKRPDVLLRQIKKRRGEEVLSRSSSLLSAVWKFFRPRL